MINNDLPKGTAKPRDVSTSCGARKGLSAERQLIIALVVAGILIGLTQDIFSN